MIKKHWTYSSIKKKWKRLLTEREVDMCISIYPLLSRERVNKFTKMHMFLKILLTWKSIASLFSQLESSTVFKISSRISSKFKHCWHVLLCVYDHSLHHLEHTFYNGLLFLTLLLCVPAFFKLKYKHIWTFTQN